MTVVVSVVARTPQQSTGPTLAEIGPVQDARNITWVDELNHAGSASVTCDPATLASDAQARLRNLAELPCELWIDRGSERVFAGPVVGYTVSDQGDLTIRANGLAYYLAYMLVASDQVFAGVDQFTIARTLVSQWQGLDFGDYGIDTSATGTSGVVRDRTYLAVEENWVDQRVRELGAVINGFDHWVDHSTRVLELATSRGSDLSGSVVLDRRGVTSPGLSVSVAARDVASDAFGRSSAGEDLLTSTDTNTALRASFGRSAVSQTWDGITVQGTLDGHVAELLTDRGTALLTPSPQLIPVAGAGVGDFGPGDVVVWDYDFGLGAVTETRRVQSVQVTLGDDGNEDMRVGFV